MKVTCATDDIWNFIHHFFYRTSTHFTFLPEKITMQGKYLMMLEIFDTLPSWRW